MSANLEDEYERYKEMGRIWGTVPRENIKKFGFPRVDQKIIDELLKLEDLASTVSDVLDSIGVCGAVSASRVPPVAAGQKLVGTAVTLRCIPERKTPSQSYHDKDFMHMSTRDLYYLAEPGDVAVVDFGGNLDVSNMGGQSCTAAKSRGLVGAVVNGAVRDVASIRKLDYPVWSRGTTPISGKYRVHACEINGPVTLFDIVVMPGDLVVADDSGVCVVPAENVETMYESVMSILEEEAKMRELIHKGSSIDELKPLYRKRYK